jgi:hypothetical protein
VSDNERRERKMQSVGCSKFSTSSDHTFEALKNWIKKHMQNSAALFTMNTETGEVAVAVIVPTAKAKDRAHAAEQFAMGKRMSDRRCIILTLGLRVSGSGRLFLVLRLSANWAFFIG